MIDDRNDSTPVFEKLEAIVPPPRFDESAAANAKPVKPIRTNPISACAISLRQAVTSGSRALVLVVIAGLVTGTLVGIAWVKEPQSRAVSLEADHSVSELTPAEPQNDSENKELRAEGLGVAGLQSANVGTGIRRSRSRARSGRGARA